MDGPECAEPVVLAIELRDWLRSTGCPAAVIDAASFWRDASVRLEYGHTDGGSYYGAWIDGPALRREVVDRLGPDGDGHFLPALRDPVSNRSVHVSSEPLATPGLALVAGELLLSYGLPFDLVVHISLSTAARARRTPADRRWTLAAWERYDRDFGPADAAGIVISWNDPQRPALRVG